MSKIDKGIQYKMIPFKDTINDTPKNGLVPKIVRRGTITTDMLLTMISSGSTFTKGDLLGVICSLTEAIEDALLSGYNVTIDGLGTFSVSAESRIVQSEDEIRANSIKLKHITFKASRKFNDKMKKATFQRMYK